MAVTDSFTLIAPGIGALLRQSADSTGGTAALSLLAGRGSIRRPWNRHDLTAAQLQPWQRGLLDVLGLDRRQYASGPISAVGSELAARDDGNYWLHAELVHLSAGLERLALLPLTGAAAVTRAEREALAPLIATHLQDSPLQVRFAASGNWFLCSPRPLDVTTAAPDVAAANELNTLMPEGLRSGGADAKALRLAMTECQMLLHDHDVNERRQRKGLPAINALWPWGGGSIVTTAAAPLPDLFGDDDFVRGIGRIHAQGVQAAPASGANLIARSTRGRAVVAVVRTEDPAALATTWIEPLLDALRDGHCERLELVLDEWHIAATRGMLRRFWRKPLPISAWPQ